MTIWGVDPSSGIWYDQVRVGEIGGNTLGLYGCRFGNQGTSILAHGYQGALHLWHDIEVVIGDLVFHCLFTETFYVLTGPMDSRCCV